MESLRKGNLEDIAIQARAMVEKFEKMSTTHVDKTKPNLYTKKVKRYRQYVKDGVVRVDQDSKMVEGVHVPAHVLHSQWILKEQALQMNVNYHCPVKWLEDREINV